MRRAWTFPGAEKSPVTSGTDQSALPDHAGIFILRLRLNALVYDLYELGTEEITIVESSVPEKFRRDTLQNGHIGPRTASFFILPEVCVRKGSTGGPPFCRFNDAISPFIPALSHDMQDFPWAWTQVPLRPEMSFVRLPNGAF